MKQINGKFLLGLALAAYAVLMLVLVAWLSHYPWTEEHPSAPPLKPKAEYRSVPDFKSIEDIPERKETFFGYLRPMVEHMNEHILAHRKILLQIKNDQQNEQPLSKKQQKQLQRWADYYAVTAEGNTEIASELLNRMNQIPPALALAQAASESAWGTSRFARKANNYFGQWCYSEGCGLVPKRRAAGASHEVASFDSPFQSVKAYFHNINTYHAYQQLRDIRQQLAEQNLPITANALLPGLMSYSERGQAYIHDIETIIRQNNLE